MKVFRLFSGPKEVRNNYNTEVLLLYFHYFHRISTKLFCEEKKKKKLRLSKI